MSKSEINETFKVFSALLEERKSELMRELDGMYTSKQVAMSVYSQKAQEVVDKIFQVSESPCDASFLVCKPMVLTPSVAIWRLSKRAIFEYVVGALDGTNNSNSHNLNKLPE